MVRTSCSLIGAVILAACASTAQAQHAGLSMFDEIRLHGMAQAIVALQPLWCAPQTVIDDVKDKLEDRDDATRVPGLLELSHAYAFDGQDFLDLVSALKSVAYSCPKLKTCPSVFSKVTAAASNGTGYEAGALLNAQRHGQDVALREAVRGSLHQASAAKRRLQLQQILGSLGNFGGSSEGFDLSKTINTVTSTLCTDITPKICDLETHSLKPTTTAVIKIILDVFKRPEEDLPLLEQLMQCIFFSADLACTRTAIEALCPISSWQDLGIYRVATPGEYIPGWGVDTGSSISQCISLYGDGGCGFDCGGCGRDCSSCDNSRATSNASST